jgi:dihydrofolate synthase/folylpolyglutamate synthase
MKQKYPDKAIHAVVAMLHDKDIEATLNELAPMVDHWFPASLKGPRAATVEELCEYLPNYKGMYNSPVDAFSNALTQAGEDDVIVVLGSFHTVGEVLAHWQEEGE